MDTENQEKPSSLITPFIHTSDSEEIGQNGLGEVRKNEKGMFSREEIGEEVKKQLWLAGPLICVSLLQSCLQLISVMFVGHLGELALSGASMATSFASVTGFSLLVSWVSV